MDGQSDRGDIVLLLFSFLSFSFFMLNRNNIHYFSSFISISRLRTDESFVIFCSLRDHCGVDPMYFLEDITILKVYIHRSRIVNSIRTVVTEVCSGYFLQPSGNVGESIGNVLNDYHRLIVSLIVYHYILCHGISLELVCCSAATICRACPPKQVSWIG